MRALVIYNSYSPSAVDSGTTVADEDTIKSAKLVAQTLVSLGWEVQQREVVPEGVELFDPGPVDLVFNMCEWTGRDYPLEVELVRRLENCGVAYTGADVRGQLWGSEKKVMKRLMAGAGLPMPATFIYEGGKLGWPKTVSFPAIIKPSLEHCSVGIEQGAVVDNPQDGVNRMKMIWEKFEQPVLVEEFLPGNEYQVFVFDVGGKIKVLPPYETIYQKNAGVPVLYFEENWIKDDVSDKVERIGVVGSGNRAKELKRLAVEAFRKMKCRGYVRLDIRERNGHLYILEINVNPRIAWDEECDMRVSAEAAGLTLAGVIKLIAAGAMAMRERRLAGYDSPSI